MMKSILKSVKSEKNIRKRYMAIYIIFLLIACCLLPDVTYSEEISSRAALVMDASTGKILYAKNPNLKLPPASTTKLMTAIVVIENANFADVVTISKHAARVCPSKAGFKIGDKVTIESLLYAALLKSANDAAVALSEAVAGSEAKFVKLMNRKAVEIGTKNTKFKNPHGLPASGQYTTAYDLSKIMSYALTYPKLREIIGTRVTEVSTKNGDSIFLKNTNKLLWYDDDLLGGKTGYTRRARNCLVCAAERGSDIIVVALLGSPSRDNLWKDTETLIDKGFEVIRNHEEPVIRFINTTDNSLNIKNASFNKKIKTKIMRKATAKKKREAKVFVKKKAKKKRFITHRNAKEGNYRIVEKIEDRNKG
jgi:D-alanyl-D-alanine carboxypeptidase (penicillin-binding protein 5/6)